MKKILISLVVLGAIGGGVAYVSTMAIQEDAPVLLCIVEDNTCNEYKSKEITAADPSGICVTVNNSHEYCRPEYTIFKLNEIKPKLKQICTDSFHGVQDEFNTCITSDTKYSFDFFKKEWAKTPIHVEEESD